jgi:hypothetical protein
VKIVVENEKALDDFAAEWGKELGVQILCYQSQSPEHDKYIQAVMNVMNVKAKEIGPESCTSGKPAPYYFLWRLRKVSILRKEYSHDCLNSPEARVPNNENSLRPVR